MFFPNSFSHDKFVMPVLEPPLRNPSPRRRSSSSVENGRKFETKRCFVVRDENRISFTEIKRRRARRLRSIRFRKTEAQYGRACFSEPVAFGPS